MAVEFQALNYGVTGADVVDAGLNRVLSLGINISKAQEAFLFALLKIHRGTLGSNPLDHIFALLSLASDGDKIEIDYRKSVREVYEETGRYILQSAPDLSLLNLAGLCSKLDP